MDIYKNISIFKKDNGGDNSKPTHDITASKKLPDGSYSKAVNVGSAWTRDGANGKYLSGLLRNDREYQGKVFDGYTLIKDSDLNKLMKMAESLLQKTNSPLKEGYPTEVEVGVPEVSLDINPEDIPF